eukprot:gene6263-6335_t
MLGWDLLAGISVAGVLLPESVAYAMIAGVPPAHAIVAAVCGLLVYGIFGRSRFAIVAPTSSAAAILAAAAGSVGLDSPAQRLTVISALVIICGGLFIVSGLARLGSLSSFVSRPVLRGFAFGLGLTIAIKQLPLVVGLSHVSGMPASILMQCVGRFQQWHLPSALAGFSALLLIVGLKQIKSLPAAFMVIVYGIVISMVWSLQSRGVQIVGKIDLQTIRPAIPVLGWDSWLKLAELAPPLFLIIFAESWGSIRNLALRHGDQTYANKELVALGCANMTAGLMQGLAVGAGFSASSANESSGGQSRLAGIFAALAFGALMIFVPDTIAQLPEPVLAAVVISALLHALDPRPLLRLWTINRDQYLALAAALSVLSLGVLEGMLVAIALSLLALVQRLAQPVISVLGQLADSHDFVDLAHYPDAKTDPQILILRPARPVFFANADGLAERMSALAKTSQAQVVIISLEESPDFDSTAADSLGEFRQQLERDGRTLFLARVHSNIIVLFQRYDSGLLANPNFRGVSVADTVELARRFIAQRQITPPIPNAVQ